MRYRLDPDLVERAGLTPRQTQALEFYDGRDFGYRAVARELGISFSTARDLVRDGLRKVEQVTKAPAR
jgi:DNA-directed RNA polymerase specialized sigma24 family protein